MKTKQIISAAFGIAVIVSLCTSTTLFAGGRTPGNTEKVSTCNCGDTKSGDCSYNTSSLNTLCECGSQCCKGNGNTVSVTLTPNNGGRCTGTDCFGATAGTATTGSGQLNTGDCGS